MRVTALAVGSRGDVVPYVALGVGLRAAGHEVRIATHERFEPLVAEHGLGFAPLAEGDLSRGAETSRGRRWIKYGDRVLPQWTGLLQDAASVARKRLSDAFAACEDADVVIVSPLATLLGHQVADARGVALIRAYYRPLGASGRPRIRQALWLAWRPFANRARAQACGLPVLGWRDPLRSFDDRGAPLLYGISPAVCAPVSQPGSLVYATGYWLLGTPAAWTPPDALATFLSRGQRPVLVTFGDHVDRDPAGTRRLVVAALERSGERGIVVGPPENWPADALPPTILAVESVPYDWLFPRLKAAVHHGGAGTTAYALRAGVPSVVLPQFADQPFWAQRVHDLGAGPTPIPRKRLTVDALAKAIRIAARDPAVRGRAAALGRSIRAQDGVSVAVSLIERHVGGRNQSEDTGAISTRPRPHCPLCGLRGELLYEGLADRLFTAPGVWHMRGCPGPRCGLVWLDPVPTEADLHKAYETYYTHNDQTPPRVARAHGLLQRLRAAYLRSSPLARGLLRVVPSGRDAMEDTFGHLPPPSSGARLLEVGPGGGTQLRRMRSLGWDTVGVDVDPVAVHAARGRGLDVRLGNLEQQRFDERSFDAIYLSHVIEHVHEPVALLSECRRVLRPGGRLVLITPNVRSRGHRTFGRSWFCLDPPRHLVLFSPTTIGEATRRAGFTAIDVRTSARIAFITWIGGSDIRRLGRVHSFDGAVALRRLIRGAAAQVGEAALLAVRTDAGEELVVSARRPIATSLPARDLASRSGSEAPAAAGSLAPHRR